MAKQKTNHERVLSALKSLKRKGLTQIDISIAIGCTQGQISHMKQGYRITDAMLGKLEELDKARK